MTHQFSHIRSNIKLRGNRETEAGLEQFKAEAEDRVSYRVESAH